MTNTMDIFIKYLILCHCPLFGWARIHNLDITGYANQTKYYSWRAGVSFTKQADTYLLHLQQKLFLYKCYIPPSSTYPFNFVFLLIETNDARRYFALSSFGFYSGGYLEVELNNFRANPENESAVKTCVHIINDKNNQFGFSLDKTINDGMNPYLEGHQERCILEEHVRERENEIIIIFKLDLKNKKLLIDCSDPKSVHIYEDKEAMSKSAIGTCKNLGFDVESAKRNKHTYYNTSFIMAVKTLEEEGLYNLFFHSCPNYHSNPETFVDFNIKIIEQNPSSYLSAGDMPLPALYCMMSILFLLSGMFWVFLLKQSKHPVFKIHYMMAVLVFLKAISLAFHGVNYHYIERLGVHLATWAILFYIAHLLKGALLFVVLVLVGTGWTFIKHVLTPRDKKLFMAVIPLQVLANMAEIILEESEEGAREYLAWKNFVILVDLLCCGCILFPVVWSIRHLQEASQTDGKAAMNLRKLKLFRHFYVMIVCYIYSTRIIVYLLKITVPFQFGWLHEMFREMATYVFFVLTAYKFRPASQNPYFALSDDEDEDFNEVLTESGATEGLKKVNSRVTKVPLHQQMLTEVTEEEKDALLGQKENSHEYD